MDDPGDDLDDDCDGLIDYTGILYIVKGSKMNDITEMLASVSRKLQDLAKLEVVQKGAESRELVSALSRELVTTQKALKVIVEDNSKLKSENHDLRAQLAGEHGFDVRDDVYYTSDGDGPFCPYCYENRARKVRLRSLEPGSEGDPKYACRFCENRY